MTGTVTWETLIWIVGAIGAAGTITAGFLFWVWRLVSGIKREMADALKEQSTAAHLEKERAKLIEEQLRDRIGELGSHVAETYATKEGVTAGLGRVEKAIDRLNEQVGKAVDNLTARLDRVLEHRSDPPPPRSGRNT